MQGIALPVEERFHSALTSIEAMPQMQIVYLEILFLASSHQWQNHTPDIGPSLLLACCLQFEELTKTTPRLFLVMWSGRHYATYCIWWACLTVHSLWLCTYTLIHTVLGCILHTDPVKALLNEPLEGISRSVAKLVSFSFAATKQTIAKSWKSPEFVGG